MQRCVPGLQSLNPDLTCKSHVTKLNQADQALCTSDAGRHAHTHTPPGRGRCADHTRGTRVPHSRATGPCPAAAAAEPRVLKLDMSRDTAAARAPTRWASVRTRHVAPLTHAPDDPSPFTLRLGYRFKIMHRAAG